MYTVYNIASKPVLTKANARRGDERVRVSKPYTRCLPARLWRQRDIDIRKAMEN